MQQSYKYALEWFEDTLCKKNGGMDSYTSAYKAAIEAIKKQIPKPPEYWSDGDADGHPVWEFRCPNCGHEFDDFGESKYCPDCGQAILWESEETT